MKVSYPYLKVYPFNAEGAVSEKTEDQGKQREQKVEFGRIGAKP
jgi:hypothetical protein